jgi:alpha-L-rhamnosidase
MVDAEVPAAGLLPSISPEFVVFSGGYRDDPNWGNTWGNTMVLMPYLHYKHYGDSDLLSKSYLSMQAHLNYLTTYKASKYLLNYGLGDWATADSSTPALQTALLQPSAISKLLLG